MKRFISTCWPILLLPLCGLLCAVFIAPPLLWSDTATGLLSWRHFMTGGTWNTAPEPDPADISRTIEIVITWWSPGQAVPLGLLTAAGLPLGPAMILLAWGAALAFALGLVRLARDLGAAPEALPWIAAGATGCWFTLSSFGMFNGGEIALIALWPWIAWGAWRLRLRPVGFILVVPCLFLLGAFAKHSFAIYGLALFGFLWVEALRESERKPVAWLRATAPLALAGALFLIGRHFVFDHGPSPSDPGQVARTFACAWGFGSFAPLLAATGGGSVVGRIFFVTGWRFEDGWNHLAWPLMLLSPLPLGFYVWLACRSRPLERFAGIVCLAAFAVLFMLMWRGGSISLEDRHYRPAAAMLIAVISAAAVSSRKRLALAARVTLGGIVLFGLAATLQRHLNMRAVTVVTGDGSSLSDMPSAVLATTQAIAAQGAGDGSFIYLPTPMLGVAVPEGRLLASDALDREVSWINARPRHGRIPLLTLVLPTCMADDGRAAAIRASFTDYRPEEWSLRTIEGWDFWQARTP